LAALREDDPAWMQEAELTASDGTAGDGFGASVAVDGSTIVVADPYHTFGANVSQGAAYVFVESDGTWSQKAELVAADGAANDYFGSSVAVSGNTVVVGAPNHAVVYQQQGAAYVFVKDKDGTWRQQAELTASDGAEYDEFGWSVAVSGSTAVVGAPQHSFEYYPEQGAAYMFVESGGTWVLQAEMTAWDGAEYDFFGWSVAASGSTVAVGAVNHTVGSNSGEGAAYVYTESSDEELTASDGRAFDSFGCSVAVSGGTAVVGACNHPAGELPGPGAAYVFVESGTTWTQQAELKAPNGIARERFGASLAVSGSTVVVGDAAQTAGSNRGQGAAYVFAQSDGTWRRQAKLTASDGETGDVFGASVAASGSTVIVGAPHHLVGSNNPQGAAYVFVPPPTVALSPTSLSFGNKAVDTASAAKKVALKNTGTATLDIRKIATGCPIRHFLVHLRNDAGCRQDVQGERYVHACRSGCGDWNAALRRQRIGQPADGGALGHGHRAGYADAGQLDVCQDGSRCDKRGQESDVEEQPAHNPDRRLLLDGRPVRGFGDNLRNNTG
jgi:nucleoside-specific outer membrane channel protein Tsx